MKWLTLNISASRVIGKSLSTDPSIQRGEGFQGTNSLVFGSFARSEAGENMRGTEHDAATADQMMTLGAVMWLSNRGSSWMLALETDMFNIRRVRLYAS
jgi:hypothetical protein